MFNTIILILGLQIIFLDNANTVCGPNTNGCYNIVTKEIFLELNNENINNTFYHEIAHAMFYEDFGRNEEIPELFEEYMENRDFIKNRYPDIYWLFDNKLKQYENIEKLGFN